MSYTIHHQHDPIQKPKKVFFKGTGALAAYTGVCYDRTYVTTATGQTATDSCGFRDHVVDVPTKGTPGNELNFAGVTFQDYAANANGQWIEIFEPGSTCFIAVNKTVTIGDYVTCIVGGSSVGKFGTAGFLGRGTAQVLETDATAISGTNLDNVVLAHLLDGPESGLVEQVALAAAGGAYTFTLNGITRITTAVTLSADATYTLADGTFFGQRKGFVLDAALTTEDLYITVTHGKQGVYNADPSTALAHLELDGSGDLSVLEWNGAAWILVNKIGRASCRERV